MVRTLVLCLSLFTYSFASAVSVAVGVTDATCGQCNGSAAAIPDGGVPPYSFVWSPAPPAGQGTAQIQGLCDGDWTVTVTDGLGNTAQATGTVQAAGTLNPPSYWPILPDCMNACTGGITLDENSLGGTPPYSYNHPFPQISGSYVTLMGLCGSLPGSLISITDANGCTIDFTADLVGNSTGGWPGIDYVLPSCGSGSSGSVALLDAYPSEVWYRVYNGSFDSLYTFPSPPYVIRGLYAGTYQIVLWDPGSPQQPVGGPVYCTFETEVTVPGLLEPCGSVSGTVYHDADEDCVFNNFDLPQPYRVLTIEPIAGFAISDGQGRYEQPLWLGNYTIDLDVSPQETTVCPVTTPVPFEISDLEPLATVDFARVSTMPLDLSVHINPGTARPGFATQVWVTVSNLSAFPSDAVSLDLDFDGLLQDPVPAGGQWGLGVIPPYGYRTVSFQAMVPADINLLGTILSYTATVTNGAGEVNTANNIASIDVTITGSYDPNDKRGWTSSRSSEDQFFIDEDTHMEYSIRFQNTGTATAETVVIRDVIDADLDVTSLEILGASHDFIPSFGEGTELVFTFDDINLPDSTTDLLASQGYISYRIKPKSPIAVGDLLENSAEIYFDFNPPIITNTTEHIVDFSTSVQADLPEVRTMTVTPNPATELVVIKGIDSRPVLVEVLTNDGRTLRSFIPVNNTFDVSQLEPGCYLARVNTQSGRSFVIRFTRA